MRLAILLNKFCVWLTHSLVNTRRWQPIIITYCKYSENPPTSPQIPPHLICKIHLPKSRQGLTPEYVETINQYQPLHCHTAPPHSLLILQFVNIHNFINDGINGEPRHRVNIKLARNVFAVGQHRVERNKELLSNLFV